VTPALTIFALVAFAANSVLCRLALGRGEADPMSFTLVRLASGAVVLAVIAAAAAVRRGKAGGSVPSAKRAPLISAALLFLYAVPFSLAYVSISAGTGALILFGCVQATMLVAAMSAGERFRWSEAAGLAVALAGLTYLVLPGLSAPSPAGSALMAVAGISWGFYSLRGRGSTDPVGDTAKNFLLAVPLAAIASVVARNNGHLSAHGYLLAVASGALASGIGYVAWYAALRGLSRIRAATVQLTVPILAAAAGVVLIGETVTLRIVLSAILILGGVGLALAGRASGGPHAVR
jgi:drug/metabolite transporter (DMT)-like permease